MTIWSCECISVPPQPQCSADPREETALWIRPIILSVPESESRFIRRDTSISPGLPLLSNRLILTPDKSAVHQGDNNRNSSGVKERTEFEWLVICTVQTHTMNLKFITWLKTRDTTGGTKHPMVGERAVCRRCGWNNKWNSWLSMSCVALWRVSLSTIN